MYDYKFVNILKNNINQQSYFLQNNCHKQELDDRNGRILLRGFNVSQKNTLIIHESFKMFQIARKTNFEKYRKNLICIIKNKNCTGVDYLPPAEQITIIVYLYKIKMLCCIKSSLNFTNLK